MRRDHGQSGGEAQYASHAAVPAPHAPSCEQVESTHESLTSRVPGWVSIGLIMLGLLVTVAWLLGFAYLLVRFLLWLFG